MERFSEKLLDEIATQGLLKSKPPSFLTKQESASINHKSKEEESKESQYSIQKSVTISEKSQRMVPRIKKSRSFIDLNSVPSLNAKPEKSQNKEEKNSKKV